MNRLIFLLVSLQLASILTAKYNYHHRHLTKHHGHHHREHKIYDTECSKEAFEEYQKDHHRESNEHDEERRQRICEHIEKNKHHNAGNHSFQRGITSMSDLSPEEYRKSLGYKHPNGHHSRRTTTVPAVTATTASDVTIPNDPTTAELVATTTTVSPITTTSGRDTNDPTSVATTTTAPSIVTDGVTTQETPSTTTTIELTTSTTTESPTTSSGSDIPAAFDWRDHGFVTAIKDQNPCGSCWAFAAIGAIESGLALKSGSSSNITLLSEQNIVDCDTNAYGCGGGLPEIAMDYIASNGGVDTEQSCKSQKSCAFNKDTVGGTVKGPKFLQENNEESLKKDLMELGPIAIGFDASHDSFQQYLSGVYYEPLCNPDARDHAMLLIGYGTDPSDGDFWTIKNSWGTGWGEEGFLRVARNKNNHCGVASDPVIPDL